MAYLEVNAVMIIPAIVPMRKSPHRVPVDLSLLLPIIARRNSASPEAPPKISKAAPVICKISIFSILASIVTRHHYRITTTKALEVTIRGVASLLVGMG